MLGPGNLFHAVFVGGEQGNEKWILVWSCLFREMCSLSVIMVKKKEKKRNEISKDV